MVSEPVLICYDGSEGAARAIDVAAALLMSSTAVVLTVAPPETPDEKLASTLAGLPGPASFHDLNKAAALDRARAGAESARRAGFRTETRAEVAAPLSDSIVEVADELHAAVIVFGSKDRTPLERAKPSLSNAVAARARHPVLTIPRGRRAKAEQERDGPAVICYDGSEHAREALEKAAALLRERRAVVVDAEPLRVSVGYSPLPTEAPWVDEAGAASGQVHSEQGAELARELGFEAEALFAADIPSWRAVVDVANDVDAGVIAVASRPTTHFGHVVDRSLAHEVAKHADRPVLIVPPSNR